MYYVRAFFFQTMLKAPKTLGTALLSMSLHYSFILSSMYYHVLFCLVLNILWIGHTHRVILNIKRYNWRNKTNINFFFTTIWFEFPFYLSTKMNICLAHLCSPIESRFLQWRKMSTHLTCHYQDFLGEMLLTQRICSSNFP